MSSNRLMISNSNINVFTMLRVAMAVLILYVGGCARTSLDARVWNAADLATAPTADVVAGIDVARRIVAENLRGADATGFKALRCAVGGNGETVVMLDFTQGRRDATGGSLDVAIQGPGLFRVKLNGRGGDKIAYTRNGCFIVNRDGQLVLAAGDGYSMDPPVTLPIGAQNISIGLTGEVTFIRPGTTEAQSAGQIQLWRFANPERLARVKDSFYVETANSGPPIAALPGESGAGVTIQGFLEQSNVEVAREQLRLKFLDEWRTALMR